MRIIEFKDKGFETAVREILKISTKALTDDDLLGINGIIIAEGEVKAIAIPWQGDSSAYGMVFPNLTFNTQNSENGQWELDLMHFSHIATLSLFEPTKDLSFLQD